MSGLGNYNVNIVNTDLPRRDDKIFYGKEEKQGVYAEAFPEGGF